MARRGIYTFLCLAAFVATTIFFTFGSVSFSGSDPFKKFSEREEAIHEESTQAASADGLNVDLVGRWPYGPCQAVASTGTVAYFGNGGSLEIVDFAIPSTPDKLGSIILHKRIEDVSVSGDYAYVANHSNGLRVIDVSVPSDPVEVGYYDAGGTAYYVDVVGNYAYIAAAADGLRVIDVSTPSSPVEVGYYDAVENASGVAVSGDYAYVADAYSGLRIIDVSTPSSPVEVGHYDTWCSSNSVAISGGYAYVADGTCGLIVVDVSTPTNPTEVGSYDAGFSAVDVAVDGIYAYVAGESDGLRVIDISTPTSPTEVGYYETETLTLAVAVDGGYAYVANHWNGLRVIDVSIPASPSEAGYFATGDEAWRIDVDGDYAFLADRYFGVVVIDVSDPENPIDVGHCYTGDAAFDVAISGDYAYVADGTRGLTVIDVSTPTSPTEVGSYDTDGHAIGVAVRGNYAYVGDDLALRVIDVSVPASPSEVGHYDGYLLWVVTVSGDYAYVVGEASGLRVIDISTPTNPTEVGSYDTDGSTFGVDVSGDYAYVANWDEGLCVIDVSNPANPTEVGSYDTGGAAEDVTVAGIHAYVADGSGGLRVIDVSNPASPSEVGYYDTDREAIRVTASGGYIYVGDGPDGVYILEYSGSGTFVCHDGVWDPGEFCGYDAFQTTGVGEMNHDCYVDLMDLQLFAKDYGQSGPALSGDLDGDTMCDLTDLVNFALNWQDSVPVCTRGGMLPDTLQGSIALSFSPDSTTIIPSDSIGIGIDTVYVVIDGYGELGSVEYTVETSPNLVILSHWRSYGSAFSGYDWTEFDPDGQHSYKATVATSVVPEGPINIGYLILQHTDDAPGWINLIDFQWPTYHDCYLRWFNVAANRTYYFASVSHAVIDSVKCAVAPTSLDFGTVFVGDSKDSTFTIRNTFGDTLTGTVSESCDHYDVVSGGGPYSLAAGESLLVTVRFEPGSAGTHHCTVETGSGCADVSCSGIAMASSGNELFVKILGGSDGDLGSSIVQTADGGFVVGGRTMSFGEGDWDNLVTKFDSFGNHLWTRTLGYGGDEGGVSAVAEVSDGGLVVFGWSESFWAQREHLITRLDETGNHLWSRTIRGSRAWWSYGGPVVETSDRGLIVFGCTNSFTDVFDLFLCKFDSTGNHIWTKTVSGSSTERPGGLTETSDGGLVVAGSTESFGAGDFDLLLAKFDAAGSLLWVKTLGGAAADWGNSVVQASGGGLVVTGYTASFGAGDKDVLLAKFDASGNYLWSRTLGGAAEDEGYYLAQSLDGGLVVTGYTASFGTGDRDILLSKFDASGNHLWSKILGENAEDTGHSLVEASDGRLVVAGRTESFGADGTDILLASFNAGGSTCSGVYIIPEINAVSPDTTTPTPAIVSQSPTITEPSPTVASPAPTTTVVCESQLTAVDKEPTVQFSETMLHQNRPNPFNPTTTISFVLPEPAAARLVIYDVQGRHVATLVNDVLDAGLNEYKWHGRDANGNEVSSGVYFYRLTAGNRTLTKKMVLLK